MKLIEGKGMRGWSSGSLSLRNIIIMVIIFLILKKVRIL